MHKKAYQQQQKGIAIIGMGCIFPKSSNLKEYWHLLFNGIDAIEDIPDSTHWQLKDYFNPDPSTPDHTYCRRGGFLPRVSFDPLSYGIPPNNLEATDTSQLLGLEVARMALEDAGYPMQHPFLEHKKVNVILGVTGTQELVIPLGARLGHPIWQKALEDSGITEEKRNEIIQRIQGAYVQWQENSFPGLLGNVVAGRIANRLNLSGTNTVADAACASALSALHTAVMELNSGKCDMSITGGVDTLNDIFMHMCFSKTGVLSHTSDAKPFSKDADGTVLGEGIGMLVLKRLEDAEKDQDRIYAVIKGIGTSSDGRTSAIYAPDARGQLKALKEAYTEADIDPSTVELVEAHGTGTRVGDKVEFDALKQCFDPTAKKNHTAIGSVKSMIGHTKASAGAAGIIKAALSLHHKVIPPTLKALVPDPELNIDNSSFYLNSVSKPWVTASHPRRSGVSAFGFGGSNFHVVLEEYTQLKTHISWDGAIQILGFSSHSKESLLKDIQAVQEQIAVVKDVKDLKHTIAWQAYLTRQRFRTEHSFRLLIVHSMDQDLQQMLSDAESCLNLEKSQPGIYVGEGPAKGKLGFVFPGQGSQYPGMGKDLLAVFPEALTALNHAGKYFLEENTASEHKPLQDYIYPPPLHLQDKNTSDDLLRGTDVAQPAIGAISLAMIHVLNRFGITPDITCGHSFGELGALYSAGWIDESTFLLLAAVRGKHMAAANGTDKDAGSMLAIQAPLKDIDQLIAEENLDVILANRNSHTQGVISGPTGEILKAKKICRHRKMRAVQLPVAAAFHSRLVQTAVAPFNACLSGQTVDPTPIDVFSNTTGTLYDRQSSEIKKILGSQLVNPVRFVDNIENMFEKKVATFVEVGPKTVLTGLIASILNKKNVTAISVDGSSGKKSGIEDLAHALCTIASKGFPVDLTHWEEAQAKPVDRKMCVELTGANLKPKNRCNLPKTPPALKPKNEKKSVSKGTDMTFKDTPHPFPVPGATPMTSHSYEAMKMVQKGLEAMQDLQAQTARAHEKFLETQSQASKTLAGMMEQTRHLALSAIPPVASTTGHPPELRGPDEMELKEASPMALLTPAVPPAAPERQVAPEKKPKITPPAESVPTADNDSQTEQILFEIVSKLTGFPVEMLEPQMDIESDLGIDSIKKVEIISALEKQIPSCEGITTDSIGSVRSLKDICSAITGQTSEEKPLLLEKVPENPGSQSYQMVSMVLMNTISDLTGFPAEMLEPSMNLESDLGIDSIKRVEILSKLEQELENIDSISSDDISKLKTIEEIILFLSKTDPATPEKMSLLQPAADETLAQEASQTVTQRTLSRQVVALNQHPTNQVRFYNGSKIDLPPKKKVYITRDSSHIADRFKKEFEKSGIPAELIEIHKNIPELPDAAGIVLLPDAFKTNTPDSAMAFLTSAFQLVHKNGPHLMAAGDQKGAFLACISFLGGGFGFSNRPFKTDPIYGGLAGLAKTAQLEWKQVLCRALDLPDVIEDCMDNAEAAVSLMMTHGSVEMGLDGDACNIPTLVNQEPEINELDLNSEDVVIITGGARGITAACAIELAKIYSPTIVLIGRSKGISHEPDWARNLTDAALLKKAILTHEFKGQTPKPVEVETSFQKIISSREIQANIQSMKNHGSRVQYFSADIRDQTEISAIFETVRKEFNAITAIIHGAGVLEDKRIVDKQVHQFKHVMETKVSGLATLLSASKQDHLKYLVLFSSIAARTGNTGQSDYSMANEILNKTAQHLAFAKSDCKIVSINWGPWEGGMVDTSLKKEFNKRGIPLIPLAAGAKQLLIEMGNLSNDPEVIIGGHLIDSGKSKKPMLSKAMSLTFGLESTPVLSAHKIDQDPVVPFALLMECHAQAAVKNNPGLLFAGMDNMRLLKGIKPGEAEQIVHVNLGKCRPEGNVYSVESTLVSEDNHAHPFIHSSCSLILKERLSKPPVLSKAAFMELKPTSLTAAQAYSTILFHGKALQGITAINGYSKKGIEVTACLSPRPDVFFKTPLSSKWVIEPMMLDAAFQAAIIWSHERLGQACLPSFIANLRLYSSFSKAAGSIRILFTVNEETKSKISGYFTFLNEENVVVASITGFEAITDPSLNEKFKRPALFSKESILSFAQGNPSDAFGEKYAIFDKEREIARLPRPPYFFMDRVLTADHPQWEMKPGGWIEAQYDIPETEWYFQANRTHTLPFCILLEIALQPCGWLAAYAGSALQSKDRLHFRNLGGKGRLITSLSRHSGTVTIRTRMTDVSKAGGMIIQDFDLEVLKKGSLVYKGSTNFGFFTRHALSNQVGIRNSRFTAFSIREETEKKAQRFKFKNSAPLNPDDENFSPNDGMPSKALRMIDEIEVMSFEDGLYDKGYIRALKRVDPAEWFFHAHFYQDPVCPGSLGVESFLQMIRFFLLNKFKINPQQFETKLSAEQTHEWSYRGQITPSNKTIQIHAHVKKVSQTHDAFSVTADGALTVDGICIYEMTDFGVDFHKIKLPGKSKQELKHEKPNCRSAGF